MPTYPTTILNKFDNPWKKLPKEESSFYAYRIEKEMESGCSGGPVFAEDLGGVIGVLQSRNKEVSYAIRWDNIKEILDRLGLEPEKNAVRDYLRDIAECFQNMRLFHTETKVNIERQYIPIQVIELAKSFPRDMERSQGNMESEEDLDRA